MHMGRTIYIQCYLVIVSKMHLERSYALGWRRSFYLKSQRQIQLRVFSPRSRRNECLHPLGGLNSILRDLTMIENLRTPDFSLHPSPDMKEYNLSKNSGLRLSVFLLRILVSGRREKHRNRYPTIPYPDWWPTGFMTTVRILLYVVKLWGKYLYSNR